MFRSVQYVLLLFLLTLKYSLGISSDFLHPSNYLNSQAGQQTIIEGDILVDQKLLKMRNLKSRSRRDASRNRSRKKFNFQHDRVHEHRWRRGVIPYFISTDIDDFTRRQIKKAMDEFESKSCIRFNLKRFEKDYVEFISDGRCYSSIGRQGQRQVVSIAPGCADRSIILHELMHLAGFVHEHTRLDRGLYINVLWWNIIDGAEKNFIPYMHSVNDVARLPYDFASVTHYDDTAFSKNGDKTLQAVSKNNHVSFGNQGHLSKIDIKKINLFYKCWQKKNRRRKFRRRKCKDKIRSCKLLMTRWKNHCAHNVMFALVYCPYTCRACAEAL